MNRLFHGGVHPRAQKHLTGRAAPVPAPIPPQVVIPLMQHVGNICKPLVSVGDTVCLGQKIGDGEGLCVPVHASVSGRVTAIEPRMHPCGEQVLSVVIENDYQDTPAPAPVLGQAAWELPAEELLQRIREAGIVGMGGAAFPTDVKARGGLTVVDTLIANARECEPYITADDALLCTYPEQVTEGLRLLAHVHQAKRVVLAVEDNKAEAIRVMREHLSKVEGIELLVLPARYPQGAEKQLIRAVTGREVPPGKLPRDVGCAVFNVATCSSVYKAVCMGEPITRRIVTVSGEGVKEPKNLIVRIGTPFSAVVEAAGGLTPDAVKVLSGGPMMGVAQTDLDVPVVKATNAILCLTEGVKGSEHPTCIRCGKCVSVCPMNLMPLYLYEKSRANDMAGLEQWRVMDCISCGCCSWVCPGKLPLAEYLTKGKIALKEVQKP